MRQNMDTKSSIDQFMKEYTENPEDSIITRAMPVEINSVLNDRFDVNTFETMQGNADSLKTITAEGMEALKTFDPLMQDVFSSLYKYTPKRRDSSEMRESHQLNHDMISKAVQTDQYARLRQYTKLDAVNSALATVSIAQELIPIIKDVLKEQADAANKLKEAEDGVIGAEKILKEFEAGGGGGSNNPSSNAQQKKQAKTTLKKAQAKYDKSLKTQSDRAGAQKKIKTAMRSASRKALDELEETSELLEIWGTEPGQVQSLSHEERLRLATRIKDKDKLKDLAKLLGKFKRLAIASQQTKMNHGFDEVYDIALGNNLSRVIPSDLMLLMHPATKMEFARKFAEGKLMQYDLKGTEKVGKGPVVCCIDSSGSISHEQDVWSKAVALSLMEIAHKQKRAFASIHFGSARDDLKTIIVKKDDPNPISKVIELAEYYLGGGTDFEKPLTEAMNIIETSDFKKADIVFLTDGECGLDTDWLAKFLNKKTEKGVKIHSVLLDVGQTSTHTVRQFSDEVYLSSNLSAENAADIFEVV